MFFMRELKLLAGMFVSSLSSGKDRREKNCHASMGFEPLTLQ